jgi:hypothetical protein
VDRQTRDRPLSDFGAMWRVSRSFLRSVGSQLDHRHFPGSSILHWDRLSEPAPDLHHLPTKPTPVSGIIFTSDTIMVQPTQTKFTFIWSAPNMIPLGPHDVIKILEAVERLPFHQATSTWPGRFIREGAKEALVDSVASHLGRIGWKRTPGLGEEKVVPIL